MYNISEVLSDEFVKTYITAFISSILVVIFTGNVATGLNGVVVLGDALPVIAVVWIGDALPVIAVVWVSEVAMFPLNPSFTCIEYILLNGISDITQTATINNTIIITIFVFIGKSIYSNVIFY